MTAPIDPQAAEGVRDAIKKPRAQSRKGRNVLASFWTTRDAIKKLDRIAALKGKSRADLIRSYVAAGFDRDGDAA